MVCEVCFQRQSLQGDRSYETGLFAGVKCMLLYLWGSFTHCLLKVYSVAVHIIALSEFPRIFAYIRVVICTF